jgi:hypothetical protein
MYERIDHVRISSYAAASQEFTLVKVYSVKGYHEKAGFAPAAGKVHCRLKYSAVLISVLQLSRTLSRHH